MQTSPRDEVGSAYQRDSGQDDLRAVILAGGSGTRLWPLSRVQAPKQFVRVLGNETLLESTIRRIESMVRPDQILIVTNEDTATGEGYQAISPYQKILEPAPRNTGPAILVAALKFVLDGSDPVMIVLPSDHLLRDMPAFHADLRSAIEAARRGRLVTIGITPRSPESGFGYLCCGEIVSGALRRVRSFHEKPDVATAT